jgi:outer membrane protein OmpA-like peptidoglycan-associated protein
MHFNKYDDFLNEDKESKLRKKEERKRKQAEKKAERAKKAKEKGNDSKAERLNKEAEEKKAEAENLRKYANQQGSGTTTQDPKKVVDPKANQTDNNTANNTANTQVSDDEKKKLEAEKNKNVDKDLKDVSGDDIKKMSKQQLNNILQKWNNKYSQEFKFKNDMPKKPAKNLGELLNAVSTQRKSAVKDGIIYLAQILSNPAFSGQNIEISGYTSTTASASYNASLSDRRAESALNAVEGVMKEKGVDTDIAFSTVGHGEDTNYLIILNDTTTQQPPKVNTKIATLTKDVIEGITNSKEARQELNRRVIIKLKGFTIKEEIGETPEDPEKPEKKVEKPELPNPENVNFNYDSYILTNDSQSLLESFASDIKKWNSAKKEDEKIKTIYISAHTKKPADLNKKQEKIQDELLAHLSTNRAYTVKRYIQTKIGDDIAKDITFYMYPVAHTMGKEKKVMIDFENSKHMQEAKSKFEDMAGQYDIKVSKRGYGGKNYTKNEALRDTIIYNLKGYSKVGKADKVIPLELWYSKGKFGLGFEEDFQDFKNEIEKIFKKSKYEMIPDDYVYKNI